MILAKSTQRPERVPFGERDGLLRRAADMLTARYPLFVFGGSTLNILPVFHFHEVTPQGLESRLRYLAENGYTTVESDAIASFVRRGIQPGPRRVALCFDDAWASLWTVAAPLLRKYGFTAITYAIPARIQDAAGLRPTLDDGLENPEAVDRSANPFVTWPELIALHNSGLIDVQSHTYSHSMIFSSHRVTGFVTPAYRRSLLSRPLVSSGPDLEWIQPAGLGAPLYAQRSRLSDARRYFADPADSACCQAHVAANGGPQFFERPGWRQELLGLLKQADGYYESHPQRDRSIMEELVLSRGLLNERLGGSTVRHICFPWTIAGQATEAALKKIGYETAIANRPFGLRAVQVGDNPYRLMRLKNNFIFSLPGAGRRFFGRNM